MNVAFEIISQPNYRLTLEISKEEARILYQLGNWSTQMAAYLQERQISINKTKASEVFLHFYHALEDEIEEAAR